MSFLKVILGSLCLIIRSIFPACLATIMATLAQVSMRHRPEKPLASSVTGTLTVPSMEPSDGSAGHAREHALSALEAVKYREDVAEDEAECRDETSDGCEFLLKSGRGGEVQQKPADERTYYALEHVYGYHARYPRDAVGAVEVGQSGVPAALAAHVAAEDKA